VVQSTDTFVDRDMRRPPGLMKSTMVAEREPAPTDRGQPANYLDLYGLSKPPFGAPSDGSNYILFNSHRRVFEPLIDHVVNGTGLVVLQGEEGVGKTETLRAAASVAAESNLRTIVVSRPPSSRISLMQLVAALEGGPGAEQVTTDDAITHFLAPPRKALLVDDVDLMPGDCLHLLLSLVQRIPNDPGGPAVIVSTSVDLTADPARSEAQLASLARNTIRMPRLRPSEIQQYIERSLWTSGGTTRRLIAADAMKLLVARSGGIPGVINRLMDAVLTAGFARGDSMITAKTVAAATGPRIARPHRQTSNSFGMVERAMQVVAVGLLVLGASAFLYKGLSGQVDRPSSASSKPMVRSAAPPVVAPPVVALPAKPPSTARLTETLPPALMDALVKRGDQSLGLGDIAAARLLYQRAADAGNAPASTALGKTYDPNYVAPGQTPDRARAAEWYQKAITLGDPHAAELLTRLGPR
jgi:type II secretory pathway predicted ATPase ExeA